MSICYCHSEQLGFVEDGHKYVAKTDMVGV